MANYLKILLVIMLTLTVGYFLKDSLCHNICYVEMEIKSDESGEREVKFYYTEDNEELRALEKFSGIKVSFTAGQWQKINTKIDLKGKSLRHVAVELTSNFGQNGIFFIRNFKINDVNLSDRLSKKSVERVAGLYMLDPYTDDDHPAAFKKDNFSGLFKLANTVDIPGKTEPNYPLLLCLVFLALASVFLCFGKFSIRAGSRESTCDLLLVILLLVMPVLALCKFNATAVHSDNENRVLAVYKELLGQDDKHRWFINASFPDDFSAWFNDRMGMRETLTDAVGTAKYALNFNYIKDRFYRYHDWAWSVESDVAPLTTDYNLKKITETLKDLNARWGKRLIVVVYPVKGELYCAHSLRKNCPYTSDSVTEYLENNLKSKDFIIYNPLQMFLKNSLDSDELIFFKDEHHMTQYGAQLIVDDLMERGYLPRSNLNRQIYAQKYACTSGEFILSADNCPMHGQSYGLLLGRRFINSVDKKMEPLGAYEYYSLSQQYHRDISIDQAKIGDTVIGYNNIINRNAQAADFTVLNIGNSAVETMSIALSTRYRHSIRLRLNSGVFFPLSFLDEQVKRDNPDVVVVSLFLTTHTFLGDYAF